MRRWFLALAVVALSAPKCGDDADEPTVEPPQAKAPLEFKVETVKQGLEVRLSEAERPDEGGAVEGITPAAATTLSAERTASLVARLPELEMPERKPFAKRSDTRPPPLAGETIQVPFPAPEAPPVAQVDQGPPRLLRYAPEGEVRLAPHLSATFSEPMVAVTGQKDAAKVRPVSITPEPPGQWRWVGTKTLLFEPDGRFPMATEYRVAIPASAKTADGRPLEADKAWTFATPPPTVELALPQSGPVGLDPVVFVRFDQRVDAQAMLPFVELVGGRSSVPLRLATEAEIAADGNIGLLVAEAEPGRALALHAAQPLTPATDYRIRVRSGAPSAEGPRRTTTEQTVSFRTYDPLTVQRQDCAEGLRGCVPGGVFWVSFNNPLDEDRFDPATVKVEPAVEGLRVIASGYGLSIVGKTKAKTSYTVRLPASLPDTFGQRLGAEKALKFQVGEANPSIQGPGKEILTLDPAAPPAISVYTTNHDSFRLRVFAAPLDRYGALSKWMRENRYDRQTRTEPPLDKLATLTVPVADKTRDELVETPVDLSPWLKDGLGSVFVWIEPTRQPPEEWRRIDIMAFVQSTRTGLTALRDADGSLVTWATSLDDGRPLEGVDVSLLGTQATARTDADGLARLAPYPDTSGPQGLVARRGGDVVLLPHVDGWWNESGWWTGASPSVTYSWFVFDDRRMYRPKEEVSVKGWLRRLDPRPTGDVLGYDGRPTKLQWAARDAYGNEIGRGETQVGPAGGFEIAIPLPESPALGTGWVDLTAVDGTAANPTTTHAFQIQEFRRPEFEVATSMDPRPYVLGESALVTVDAQYYAGGALPGATTAWTVTWSPGAYQPPGWDGYSFGTWTPWWGGWFGGDDDGGLHGSASLAGVTDALGAHTLKIDFLALNPPRPMAIVAEGTVFDVNRQRWSSSQRFVLHPASVYVGLKADRGFYAKDQEIRVDTVAVGIEGEVAIQVPVAVTLARLEWTKKGREWRQEEVDPQTCSVTSSKDPARCAWTPKEGGSYRITAKTTDSAGRPTESTLQVWVSGGKQKPERDVVEEQVLLVPDTKEHAVGDVAEIFVQAPFWPAEGLMTLRRSGLVETKRIHLDGPTTTLKVPITEGHVPNVTVAVDLVGAADRTDDAGNPLPDKARRVAYASGELDLPVPPATRTLTVVATPRQASLDPGGETTIDVKVRDHRGLPVPDAEVAVVVVDEAVLALTGAVTPNPLDVFYARRDPGVSEWHSRGQVVLSRPDLAGDADADALPDAVPMEESESALGLTGSGMGGGGAMDEGGSASTVLRKSAVRMAAPAPPPAPMAAMDAAEPPTVPDGPKVELRTDFRALALWAPRVRTGAGGDATVALKLPDSLTRYRVMAVAVAGEKQFGAGESTVTARKPVMLRPSPPRFLNFGDRVELPLVVQNQTDRPMEVEVAIRMGNARVLADVAHDATGRAVYAAGRKLSVPANDRRELRIPVGTELSGTARFQALVVSGGHTDAASFDLPVWTPATSEAFATYGEIDKGAIKQPIQAPTDVWAEYGGLEITTSSTALQALTDAVLYLANYPYDCSEQIASRILAVAALRDVLTAFEAAELPPPAELEAAVTRDLERLQRRQLGNGGWGFWGDQRDEPYLTVHVMHTLVRAKAKGFDVDARMIARGNAYLGSIERHIPSWYSEGARDTIIAYSVYVRHLLGEEDGARARRLAAKGVSLEAQGWIAPTLKAVGATSELDALVRGWENAVAETAAGAQFTTGYSDKSDYVLLHSSRRTDAILLDALIEVRPKSDLVPKVVRGLLGHRVRGRWSTTQENGFVLVALDRYFRTYEKETPDFVARAWLGATYAGDHAFKGRTTERANIDVPMSVLLDPGGTQDLVLQKDGAGRMYYRIGLRYAPIDLVLEPADYGFTVERAYEGVDDPADVRKDDNGIWHVKAGARVRVRLTMVAVPRRTHVALVDPLPAGFEAQNPALKVTGQVPDDPNAQEGANKYWWWFRPWYEHQNLRDERAEAFTTLLYDGVYTYSYVAAATTPGQFVVPPTKAEEMYHPETFGRSATDRVIVE